MRNPGWSPTTVMCPLQGEVSSNRKIESTRLAVGKGTLQDNAELSCGSRMIETLFQILNVPARVEPSEERARGRKVASDVDWSGRRREVRLAEIDRHVLKVRVSVGRAKEPCVGEMRSGCPRLAMRWHTPTRRRGRKRTRRSWSASASGHSFVS